MILNTCITQKIERIMPNFSISSGDSSAYKFFDEGIGSNGARNWRIEFYENTTLSFDKLGNIQKGGIDIFLCGGGENGEKGTSWMGGLQGADIYSSGGKGGAGGYRKTIKSKVVSANTDYNIVIGGSGNGTSSAFGENSSGGVRASGGNATSSNTADAGGDGGYAFDESSYETSFGAKYKFGGGGGGGAGFNYEYGTSGTAGAGGASGGGKGGAPYGGKGADGVPNSGGGGGGAGGTEGVGSAIGYGASGIVIIRNAR